MLLRIKLCETKERTELTVCTFRPIPLTDRIHLRFQKCANKSKRFLNEFSEERSQKL